MIARAEILACARREVANGTRWVHQKALLGVALDCIGGIAAIAAHCGSPDGERFLASPHWRQYGPTSQPEKLYAACREFMDPITIAEALPADVYLMAFMREPQHFGFLSALAPPYLIHTWAAIGKICEHGIDAKWQRRIIGAWRLRGIGPWPA